MWWSSRGSPLSQMMDACMRLPCWMRWWCTAPTASTAGIGACSASTERSLSTSSEAPASTAASAAVHKASMPACKSPVTAPSASTATSNVEGRTLDTNSGWEDSHFSCDSVMTGVSKRMRKEACCDSSSSMPLRPKVMLSDMRSRWWQPPAGKHRSEHA